MKRNLPDIGELFKSALGDNEEFPSSKVWDGIANVLDRDDVVIIKRKYNNLKRIASVLFFLLLGLSIYELENRQSIPGRIGVNEGLTFEEAGNPISKNNKKHISKYSDRKINVNNSNSSGARNGKLLSNKSNKIAFLDSVKQNIYSNYLTQIPDDIVSSVDKNKGEKYIANDGLNKENAFIIPLGSLFRKSGNENIADSSTAETLSDLLSRNKKSFLTIDEKKSNEQIVKRKDKKSHLFSVTAFFSPDFASYRLQNDQQNDQSEDASDIKKSERHELSSTAGALIDYNFKKHFSIESGLSFSNTNILVAPKTIFAQRDYNGDIKYRLNTSSGYGYVLPSFTSNPNVGDSLYTFTSTHLLQYISLPALIKFNFSKKKIGFDIKTGVSVNFLTKAKVETSVENGSDNEQEVVKNLYGLKKIYFSGTTGIGINYRINDKFTITFDPAFRYAFNSINNNAPVKSYPNSFMLPVGLKINL